MQKAEEGEFALNFAELEVETLAQDVRQRLLQDWWAQHEVLLVCLCDEASGSSGLLALRKTPVSVRFYEVSGGRLWARLVRADWLRGQRAWSLPVDGIRGVGWSLQVDWILATSPVYL